MTSYFNEHEHELRDISRELGGDDGSFVRWLTGREEEIVQTVSLVTGDRQFPDEWRERIQNCVATKRLYIDHIPNNQAVQYAAAVRDSQLIRDLHALFHELARERIEVRFGLLTDSPVDILRRRDAHDEETP